MSHGVKTWDTFKYWRSDHQYLKHVPQNQRLYPTAEEIYVKCLHQEGDSLLHISICYKFLASQVLLKGSKEMEIGGLKIRAVGRMVHLVPRFSNITSHKSGWQYVAQWFPSLWTPSVTRGWQTIHKRCQHEGNGHLLATDTWWLLVCQDVNLGTSVGQTLYCQWWLHWSDVYHQTTMYHVYQGSIKFLAYTCLSSRDLTF